MLQGPNPLGITASGEVVQELAHCLTVDALNTSRVLENTTGQNLQGVDALKELITFCQKAPELASDLTKAIIDALVERLCGLPSNWVSTPLKGAQLLSNSQKVLNVTSLSGPLCLSSEAPHLSRDLVGTDELLDLGDVPTNGLNTYSRVHVLKGLGHTRRLHPSGIPKFLGDSTVPS